MVVKQQPPRMTHEEKRQRRERIARAVGGGSTLPRVCAKFCVSIRTVYDACREFGVEIPDQRRARVSA